MTRLFVVAFLGKHRSENADHAHEVGPLMFVPLVILAVLAVVCGYWLRPASLRPMPASRRRVPRRHLLILGVSVVALVDRRWSPASSSTTARTRTRSPSRCSATASTSTAFYDNFLVRYFQDAFAAIVHFFDELLINGLLVGGLSRAAASFGNLFRRVQSGNLQGYAYRLRPRRHPRHLFHRLPLITDHPRTSPLFAMLAILVLLPIVAFIAILLGAPARLTAIGAAAVNLALGLYAAFTWQCACWSFSLPVLEKPALHLAFGFPDGMSVDHGAAHGDRHPRRRAFRQGSAKAAKNSTSAPRC